MGNYSKTKPPKRKYNVPAPIFTASDSGEVYRNGKLMNTYDNGYGYLTVKTTISSIPIHLYVHRIVAEHFLGKIPDGMVVNHKDRNKKNNHISNLEIVTARYNVRHAIGKPVVSNKNGVGIYYPGVRAAEEDGFDASTICKVIKGKKKTHGGFSWVYV